MTKIRIITSTSYCRPCEVIKEILREKGVPFKEEVQERGYFPRIFIDGIEVPFLEGEVEDTIIQGLPINRELCHRIKGEFDGQLGICVLKRINYGETKKG